MILKSKFFCGIACSIEWFDFALYGYFGPIFANIFFPHASQTKWVALMTTYLIFAIGFSARPLGALIFGYIGDKYGRLTALKITPPAISLLTASMALLPTHQSIGNTAIILLCLIRVLQGICLGGEFSGNIVYLCESSPRSRYTWGSIASSTASTGILLASITASCFYYIFPNTFMYQYGWRIAFALSIPLGLISFFIRQKMIESNEFETSIKSNNPIKEALLKHKKIAFLCIGLLLLHAISFYFIFMFIPLFLNQVRHLHTGAALVHNSIFLFIHIGFISLFGLMVNRVGGMRSQCITGLLFLLLSIPIFYFIAYGTLRQVEISIFLFSLMSSFNAAIIPGLLTDIIPVKVRYVILGLSFNIAFGIFGGTTPYIGLYLVNSSGNIMLPGIYLSIAALVTLAAQYSISKMSHRQ